MALKPLANIMKNFTKHSNINSLKHHKLVHGTRQSPNLKRLLMKTKRRPQIKNKITKCNRGNCELCINIIEGEKLTLTNGKTITPNTNLTCSSQNLVYCILCPTCKGTYIGECKQLNKRMNLHRSHSNPMKTTDPPLPVNRHLKKCSNGNFRVFPFYKVKENHEVARKEWELHFQKIIKPTLH